MPCIFLSSLEYSVFIRLATARNIRSSGWRRRLSQLREADCPKGAYKRGVFMDHHEAIRLRIRTIRESRGLTQQDIADLMGISRDYYQKVESGVRTPNLRFIGQFGHAMGVSPGALLVDVTPGDELLQKWPEGFRILQLAAEGPVWKREQLQRLFEAVYGDQPEDDKNPH